MELYYLPYFNEAFILLSAIYFAIGWRMIRHQRMQAHKRFMLAGTIFAILFFAGYAIKAIWIGNTSFGGPLHLRTPYMLFLQMHSVLASVAAVLGIITLGFALKGIFRKHKKIGPWTVSIWFVTTATGLAVFLLLYVIYPPGPTGALHALLGK